MERLAAEGGRTFTELPRPEKEQLWEVVKRAEKESEPAKREAARR